MANKLRPKYLVLRINEDTGMAIAGTEQKSTDPDSVDSPFVLMPRKDPAAFAAVLAYAEMCEPELATEIRTWLETVCDAEPAFGTQGRRNFQTFRKKAVYGG